MLGHDTNLKCDSACIQNKMVRHYSDQDPRLHGTTFSKLIQNLVHKHPDEFTAERSSATVSSQTVLSTLPYLENLTVYGWICYVVRCLPHFSVFNCLEHWEHIKHCSLSLNTFLKYMELFTVRFERNVFASMPEWFTFVFNQPQMLITLGFLHNFCRKHHKDMKWFPFQYQL